IAKSPEDTFSSESQYKIGESYEKMGNNDLAQEAFQKILQKYPQSIAAARIHLRDGILLEEKKDYKKAIEKYRLATNLARNEVGAEAQKRIGDCYYFRKDYHNAMVEYLKVVYLYDKYTYFAAPAQYMAGESNGKERFWEEARKAYKKVIENYPETEWAKKAQTELERIADK
ncbi:MAG TPA: tetratricopeptide repeat protein, partial [bacterium]|nr:tetratricopeptide repeat protein [bacterium]